MEPETPRPWKEIRRRLPFMTSAIERLRRVPLFAVLAMAVILLSVLGMVDYWTERDLSFLVFYLLPVYLVTLRAGLWPGIFMSVAGTATWFMANVNLFQDHPGDLIPFWNLAGTLGVFVFFTCLLHALVNALEQERAMNRYDPLTGVANRRYFLELLDVEVSRSRRYRRPFTLVYMDLDDFKAINDRQGHAAGDALLRKVAETLVRGTRDVDTPGRLGGDEFALLMPETGYDAARSALWNLRKQIATVMSDNGWPVTTTMGAATYTSPLHSAEEMIGLADRLMYSKKAEGKDGVSHRVVEGGQAPPPRRD
jgi:diguanylate cyclase (GGDEF)-like protein